MRWNQAWMFVALSRLILELDQNNKVVNLKILIDINHPAHVHYFKNMIKLMSKKNIF